MTRLPMTRLPLSRLSCRRPPLSRRDRGSVLALVPAGFLVLILLAALAVDSAVAYLGQDQLHDALAAAVNDSVTAGLDNNAFYRNGTVTVDPGTAAQVVCASILAQNVSGLHQMHVSMAIFGNSVRLVGHAQVDAVFGRSIPGYGVRPVSAAASAVVVNGPVSAPIQQADTAGLAAAPLVPLPC